MRHLTVGFGLLLALSQSSCGLDLGQSPFFCNTGEPKCPDGYQCMSNKWCVKQGSCPDFVPECQAALADQSTNTNTSTSSEPATAAKCGNNICDGDESCSNCAQDCGKCKVVCGDGRCDDEENSHSCAIDCKGTTPGSQPGTNNGSAGGTGTGTSSGSGGNSNSNNGSCQNGATKCDPQNAQNILVCKNGTFKSEPCLDICKASGVVDFTNGCSTSSTTGTDACQCGSYSDFGGACNNVDKICNPKDTDLTCQIPLFATAGYCTKYCTADADCANVPANTSATCSLDLNGKKACGFICDLLTLCPNGLTCDYIFSECAAL